MRKDLFLTCHFWKSSVERNKSISQSKTACHKNFLLLLKIFQSTTYPTAHNLCISRPKRVPVKKFRPTRKYLNIKQLEVPNLHKKRRMNEKKINISRTLMSKEILQKRYNYSASNIFFHFFRTKHKCSHNQPKHNQSSIICKFD